MSATGIVTKTKQKKTEWTNCICCVGARIFNTQIKIEIRLNKFLSFFHFSFSERPTEKQGTVCGGSSPF